MSILFTGRIYSSLLAVKFIVMAYVATHVLDTPVASVIHVTLEDCRSIVWQLLEPVIVGTFSTLLSADFYYCEVQSSAVTLSHAIIFD